MQAAFSLLFMKALKHRIRLVATKASYDCSKQPPSAKKWREVPVSLLKSLSQHMTKKKKIEKNSDSSFKLLFWYRTEEGKTVHSSLAL